MFVRIAVVGAPVDVFEIYLESGRWWVECIATLESGAERRTTLTDPPEGYATFDRAAEAVQGYLNRFAVQEVRHV